MANFKKESDFTVIRVSNTYSNVVSQFNNPYFSEVFYNPFNSFLTLLFVEERLLAYHENVGSNLARQFNETKQTLRSNLLMEMFAM